MSCAVVLLAAGGSIRMGNPKMLRKIDGQTMLQRAINTVSNLNLSDIWVVLGSDEDKIRPSHYWPNNVSIVSNKKWQDGMSSSIIAGLQSALDCKTYDSLMVVLADMPLISTDYLQMIINDNSASIVASEMDSQIMPPIKLSSLHFDDILQLKGDGGAKELVQNHIKSSRLHPLGNLGMDVDTEQDFLKVSKFLE